jgi:hypothetical protein
MISRLMHRIFRKIREFVMMKTRLEQSRRDKQSASLSVFEQESDREFAKRQAQVMKEIRCTR